MSTTVMTATIVLSFLVMLVLGLPIAFTLLGVSVIFAALFINPTAMYSAYVAAFSVMTKDLYIAVPLFVFMATLLQYSGIASLLYDAMYKWFAGLRGGLAIGTVAMCTLIAAMTGLGGTGILTIGFLAYPEMMKRGYDKLTAIGCIPPAGALGPIIPPSVVMIVLGGFAGISIGKLFMGGVFPGLLMSFFFMAYIAIRCWRNPSLGPAIPLSERATRAEKLISLRGTIPALILIFLVLGTIYTGAATPTEAGGVGAFGALVVAAINRQLNWKNLKDSVFSAGRITCMVIWLLMGGTAFTALLTMTGVGHSISAAMAGLEVSPTVILIIMMIIPFILGMFVDGGAIMMLCLPVFMPVVRQLGIDELWFGLLFSINVVIGYVTPPFGMNLFYTKGIVPPDVTMADIYRSVIPYVVIMVVVLIVGMIWPPLLTWLPNMMIK